MGMQIHDEVLMNALPEMFGRWKRDSELQYDASTCYRWQGHCYLGAVRSPAFFKIIVDPLEHSASKVNGYDFWCRALTPRIGSHSCLPIIIHYLSNPAYVSLWRERYKYATTFKVLTHQVT